MDIVVVEKEIGNVIEIEENVPALKIPKMLGKDYYELYEYLKESGETTEQFPYTRYIQVDWERQLNMSKLRMFFEVFTKKWLFRAGVPSKEKLSAKGTIISESFPKAKYIRALHIGPYEKVSDSYAEMINWAKANKFSVKPESFEFYLNDPQHVPVAELKTELFIPVHE